MTLDNNNDVLRSAIEFLAIFLTLYFPVSVVLKSCISIVFHFEFF